MKNAVLVMMLGVVVSLGCTVHASDSAPTVPAALQVASTEKLSFSAKGQGVQIYQWQPKKDNPTEFEWAFKGPEADLFDADGKKIGHHFAGPTWEGSDGSSVVGTVKAKVDSTTAGAVPWLLLTAKSHSGTGVFSQVTSVQRLETSGGKAPTTPGSKAGEESRVPYTATYYFYIAG